jgi:hypothetical protein
MARTAPQAAGWVEVVAGVADDADGVVIIILGIGSRAARAAKKLRTKE